VPRMQDEVRDEETVKRAFVLQKPFDAGTLLVNATVYPNRSDWTMPQATEIEGYSPEMSDDEVTALRACAQLANLVQSWDMVGPWPPRGEPICGEDEMIPLTVPVLRTVYPWIVIQLSQKIQEAIYPNLQPSRQSRRR
jgi:hypothetical protein